MRVLVLSQFFEPEPLPRPMDIAQALQERGHSVCVLTGFPNYPAGKLYPGYRLHLVQKDNVRGIPIVRTILYPSHSTSSLGRIINYCSFMVSAIWGALFTPPCDVIYVWHPPLTIGVSAWIIGLMKGAPFVYDVQDIWPESGIWSGMLKNPLLIGRLRVLEKFIYRRAKHIMVVTEAARKNLIGKGVPPSKVSIASQLIDEKLFGEANPKKVEEIRRQYGLSGRFTIMFAGNMGLLQGLETVLHAAALLTDEPQVLFVLVGDGTDRERLIRQAQEMDLKNILFIDRQPAGDMPHFMAAADAMLLSLQYSDVCEFSIPLKTFAYLAAGRPIVAAIKGAAADLVEKAGAGIIVPPEAPEALAAAVQRLMQLPESERAAMGDSGRRYMVANHAKEKMLDEHIEALRRASASAIDKIVRRQ